MRGGPRQAANLAAARRRMPRASASPREDERHAAEMQARAERLAVTFGFAPCCGVHVREDGLHDFECPDVPPERRRAR